MKPAWDQLGDEYAASSSVVIADVDCTESGEELCENFEIRGCKSLDLEEECERRKMRVFSNSCFTSL